MSHGVFGRKECGVSSNVREDTGEGEIKKAMDGSLVFWERWVLKFFCLQDIRWK